MGRDRGGKEGRNGGGEGTGGALDMGSPLETSSGSAPGDTIYELALFLHGVSEKKVGNFFAITSAKVDQCS